MTKNVRSREPIIRSDAMHDLNNSKPLISVIIPTYNREKMLDECLKNVLSQNYESVEIVVVDDNSTDNTENLLRSYIATNANIKYIKNKSNLNAGRSRNVGYRVSKGKYLVFLDDDDYYTDRDFFTKAIAIHQQFELAFVTANASVLFSKTGKLVEDKINIEQKIAGFDYLTGFQTNYKKPLSTFTSVFNRESLDKADFTNMVMMNDSAIYLRALLYGDAFVLADSVGVYRIHDSNITNNMKVDFIIDNLREKMNIFERSTQVYGSNGLGRHWLSTQFKSSLRNFFSSNKVSRGDIQKLIRFLSTAGKAVEINLWIYLIALTLKHLVKGSYEKKVD